MKNFLKVSGHAIAAASVSLLGLALSPALFNVLPPKVAMGVSIAGVVYQATTGKAIQSASPATDAAK